MAWKEQVSRSNLGLVSCNNGDYTSGARNLFGEMPESDWRSPSRVLEVTIHQAYYPITEKVLHLVFDPFGEVEHVHVLGGLDHVLAQVVFKTKHAAAEAFGELHGRCVYSGCCQLDIKWGSSQDVRCCSTMVSSSPAMLQASTTTTVIEGHISDSSLAVAAIMATDVVPDITDIKLHTTCSAMGFDVNASVDHKVSAFPLIEAVLEDLSSKKVIVEADATGGHTEVISNAVTCGDIDVAVQSMVVLNTLGHGTSDEEVLAVPMVAKDEALVHNLTVTIWSPMTVSRSSQVHDHTGPLHAFGKTHQGQNHVMANSLNMACSTKNIPASKCESRRYIEWQPWPPPMPTVISHDSTAVHPTPWLSFQKIDDDSARCCFSMFWKPPWPLFHFCILPIPQDLGNQWNLPMDLPEAKAGIKAHSLPLHAHGREITQRARFWQARTTHMVQFSVLSVGDLCQPAFLQRFELVNIEKDPNSQASASVNSGIIFNFDAQLPCLVRSKLMLRSITAMLRAQFTTTSQSATSSNLLLLTAHFSSRKSAQVLQLHISRSSDTS